MRLAVTILAWLLFLASGTGAGVKADWKVDETGRLVSEGEGQVLSRGSDADDGNDDADSGSGNSGTSGSSGSGSSGSSGGGEASPTPVPTPSTAETRTEVRLGEGERIRTRVKDEETRTDVWSGGVKVRFEQKEGRMVIKAEQAGGEEVELREQRLFKIEERADKDVIKVAIGSGSSVVFARGQFGATTTLPISVDLATNSLQVTTAAGTKVVTVLPEAAVANLLAANVIDRLGAQAVAEAARSGDLTGVAGIIPLGERNSLPVYEIRGVSDQRLLGFIPVAVNRTVLVSAQTGEVVETRTNFVDRLVDTLAF